MASTTELKGFDNIHQQGITSMLQANIIAFFDWGFLNKGGFINIDQPVSTALYGGDRRRLRPVERNGITDGRVWEAFHKNFVWESGISGSRQPISISGVYVGGSYYPTSTTGIYAHYIDYENGRVVFNSAISTASTVSLNYSYKYIDFCLPGTFPFLQEVQFNNDRIDSSQFLATASGNFNRMVETRIQLPAVAVEVVRGNVKPYELGGSSRWRHTDVLFHVMTISDHEMVNICDAICQQDDKTIFTYNTNNIAAANDFPTDYRGTLGNSPKTFPQLVDNPLYLWRKVRFFSPEIGKGQTIQKSVFYNVVKMKTEMIVGDV